MHVHSPAKWNPFKSNMKLQTNLLVQATVMSKGHEELIVENSLPLLEQLHNLDNCYKLMTTMIYKFQKIRKHNKYRKMQVSCTHSCQGYQLVFQQSDVKGKDKHP